MAEEEITRMYELLDALEEALKAADPASAKLLQKRSTPIMKIFLISSTGRSGHRRQHFYIICLCQ